MNVSFDPKQDILQVSLRSTAVYETSQIAPGLILDYDEDGNVIGLEVRQASLKIDDPYAVNCSIGQINQDKPQIKSRGAEPLKSA